MSRSNEPSRSARTRHPFDIDEFARLHPSRSDALRELFAYFEARSFLPNLHDVNRFVERWSVDEPPALRARAAAPATVFARLATVSDDEFSGILEGARLRAAGKSDLDIISDAVLGPRKKAQPQLSDR